MHPDDWAARVRRVGRCSPEECIRTSFEFLLEREAKEAILREFDLTLIGRYFPEYERELSRRLSN